MKLLSFVAVLLLHVAVAFGQNAIKVDGVTRSMSQGEQPGFAVVLPKADVKLVETAWGTAVQGKGKIKAAKLNNEWATLKTVLPQITQDTLDIYARTISTTEGVVLEVFFKDKSGFINAERTTTYPQAEKFVRDFAVQQHKATIQNQITAAQDVLESYEKEYTSLSKELEKLNSNITKNKLEIDDNKNKISTNDSDQERLRSQIQAQKKKVVEAGKLSPEAKKAEEKNLSALDKELAKLMKDKEKTLQGNVKCEANIRDAELEIKNKEVEIEAKQKQISEQHGKIKDLQDQLTNVQ